MADAVAASTAAAKFYTDAKAFEGYNLYAAATEEDAAVEGFKISYNQTSSEEKIHSGLCAWVKAVASYLFELIKCNCKTAENPGMFWSKHTVTVITAEISNTEAYLNVEQIINSAGKALGQDWTKAPEKAKDAKEEPVAPLAAKVKTFTDAFEASKVEGKADAGRLDSVRIITTQMAGKTVSVTASFVVAGDKADKAEDKDRVAVTFKA